MLKYPCLVLDHDDTVVQSMKTLSYPFFLYVLSIFRPGETISMEDFISDCHHVGFGPLCTNRFGFTPEEMKQEHKLWMGHILSHTPAPYPGIRELLSRQKQEGGLICVVSHSSGENILRDYRAHFDVLPDAIYGWDLPEEKRKPNPYPLEHIMETFDLQPHELLMVDDMKLGWKMAQPVGVKTVYAGWSDMGVPEIAKEMEKLCDYSFYDLDKFEEFLF